MFVETPQKLDPLETIPVREVDPDREEVLRILRKTHAVLSRPYGWLKKTLAAKRRVKNSEYYGYCLIGGLSFADHGTVGYVERKDTPLYKAAELVSIEAGLQNQRHIPEWNDDPKTRKKDVLEALERAIVKAEEG